MEANRNDERKLVWPAIFVFAVLSAIVAFLLLPGVSSGPVALRSVCKNNLKQILLALHTYHDEHGSFPPAYVADKHGRPLFSWRVLILPYLDERPLYDAFHLDEPWDSPHNLPLSNSHLDAFHCAEDEDSDLSMTNFLAVIGPNTAWTGEKPVSKKDISDPLGKTIHVVEAAQTGIRWAEPRDLYVNQIPLEINPKQGFGISSKHRDCAQVGFCDGSVKALKNDLPREQLRRMLERNDGRPVGDTGE